jgi:hypothetical protein
MWPFSNRVVESQPPPAPDSWTIGTGERDGFPMIVRVANAYTDLAPIPTYDHHVIISIHVRSPQPNGFPSSEEGDDLQSLETTICGLLEADNHALFVLAVTNNGLRDLIFYTRNVESAKTRSERTLGVGTGFVVEFWIEPDASWEVYRSFCHQLTPISRPETGTST